MRKTALVMLAQFFLIALLGGNVSANWLGVGISCEPRDITGGGFFADVAWNARLIEWDRVGLSLRPILGVGPLPLDVQYFIADVFLTVELPLGNSTLYAGIGYGIILPLRGGRPRGDLVFILGLGNVTVAEDLQMYAQVRFRGAGFFASPGVGLQWAF